MQDVIARLKAANADIESGDDSLREELRVHRESASFSPESAGGGAQPDLVIDGQTIDRQDFVQETIVLRTGRPVLAVVRSKAQLVFDDPESQVWKARLQRAESHLVRAAQSVGRIEVEGHRLAWLGTGWLVGADVIVSNRHVASEFGRQRGSRYVFRQGLNDRDMTASIDFIEEIDSRDSLVFRLEEIMHIEDEDGPDLAFLRVTPVAGHVLASPIELATKAAEADEMVAVIGYPARDGRIPDQDLMDKIFGQVYDKKRLAPGQIKRVGRDAIRHDCSTLGGNSGSVVLSLQTGRALGLHFAGRFLEANFAVPSVVVGERLDDVRSGVRKRPAAPVPDRPEPAARQKSPARSSGSSVSYVFPIRVTVDVGEPYPDTAGGTDRAAPPAVSQPYPRDEGDELFTETVPADYRDRRGYVSSFLGDGADVPPPTLTRDQADVLSFTFDGRTEQVLEYEHFSVVMSTSRRLCRFSAVNIDGKRSKSMPRPGWRRDSRIPAGAQIRDECYGNPPKFARGHMTRREDPIWGGDASASKGNGDSMHVTNVVPQMQPFNAGVWLQLENYALQHARQDDMKISVFTGPFLASDNPVQFGVQIPVEFWKVIAFIHDETRELCATGYTMSQEDFLSEEEFVFGKHKTAQRSIAEIERRAGLSFGPLAELDPFEDVEGIEPEELTDLTQIRFLKRR